MISRLSIVSLITIAIFCSPGYGFDGYGVYGVGPESTLDQLFPLIQKAGIRWVRADFAWREVEPREGEFQFERLDKLVKVSKKYHTEILGILWLTPNWATRNGDQFSPPDDLQKWRHYVETVMRRYKNDVRYWQIWNEPDIKKFWTAEETDYVRLLKASYGTAKAVDPEIKVVSAGLDGRGEDYIDRLLSLGLNAYCDIIAFHPYANNPQNSLERVQRFLSVLKRHQVEKPLWLTEIGWQTGGWPQGPGVARDEELKASNLKRAYEMLGPYAEKIFWYQFLEGPNMYGLIELRDGQLITLPSYTAYLEMTQKGK